MLKLIWSGQSAAMFFCIRALGHSEHDESLSNVTFNSLLLDSDHIESDGFGDWSALANGDDVSLLDSSESWGQMSWQVVMSLLESVVFLDVMQVIPSEDYGSCHLGWENDTLEDSASNGDVWGEWAFFVNVSSLNSGLWGLEAYIQRLGETHFTYQVQSSCSIWVQRQFSYWRSSLSFGKRQVAFDKLSQSIIKVVSKRFSFWRQQSSEKMVCTHLNISHVCSNR